jgi:hypothetical protein
LFDSADEKMSSAHELMEILGGKEVGLTEAQLSECSDGTLYNIIQSNLKLKEAVDRLNTLPSLTPG